MHHDPPSDFVAQTSIACSNCMGIETSNAGHVGLRRIIVLEEL
mgnify:CR=1 FL=1